MKGEGTMWDLSQQEIEAMQKRNYIIKMVYIIGISLCIVIAFFSAVIKPSINLNKYTEIVVEGYNGYAKARLVFDTEKFEKDYGWKLERASRGRGSFGGSDFFDNFTSNSAYSDGYAYSVVRRFAQGDFNKDTKISNGDTIVFRWDINYDGFLEAYGYRLKYDNFSMNVAGLYDAMTFDPFVGVDIYTLGVAPYGYVDISTNNYYNDSHGFSYSLRYDGEYVKNGDKVVVEAYNYSSGYGYDDIYDYCIETYNAVPTALSKEFMISDMPEYVFNYSGITDSFISKMETLARSTYQDSEVKNMSGDAKLESLTYLGSYVCTLPNYYRDYNNHVNGMYMIFDAKIHHANTFYGIDEVDDVYWVFEIEDIYKDFSGILYYDIASAVSNKIKVAKWWSHTGFSSLSDVDNWVAKNNKGFTTNYIANK